MSFEYLLTIIKLLKQTSMHFTGIKIEIKGDNIKDYFYLRKLPD